MTVTVHIPTALRTYCKGAPALALSAQSVRDALTQLEHSHPPLYRSVCNETGAVRQHINVFVNETHIRERNGLDTALTDGDVLSIYPAVSGG